jgi:hypothetical protein
VAYQPSVGLECTSVALMKVLVWEAPLHSHFLEIRELLDRTRVEPVPAYNPAPSTYEENPLYETARWMLLLTFNDFISLATKIVKKEGYNPPTTPFELANLLNDWAISECREQKP